MNKTICWQICWDHGFELLPFSWKYKDRLGFHWLFLYVDFTWE